MSQFLLSSQVPIELETENVFGVFQIKILFARNDLLDD